MEPARGLGALTSSALWNLCCVQNPQPILAQHAVRHLALPERLHQPGVTACVEILQGAAAVGQVQTDGYMCGARYRYCVFDVSCPFIDRRD